MLFSSLEFLFLFLPLTLLVYYACPLKARNLVLLLFSLVFYGWGEPIYIFLMVFTIAVDYLFGFLVGKYRDVDKKKSRVFLVLAVVINLLLLGFFKYIDFFIINLSKIPFLSGLEPLGVALPIGISFYTFQALSYVIDVYRADAPVQKSPVAFGAYVTLFPQLIAGPIVRYRDIDEQLSERRHSLAMAMSGARTFFVGLAKKILLANSAGAIFEAMRDMPTGEQTVVGAWLGIVCYTFQIYFDFSGYSDMAIGLGKIFGFRFLENFNYPYISKSITEFWRRWHISLSSWFREYVYIPLGGNRCSKGRMYFNLLTVWFLTGFWHGASWNFVIWGLYYFVLLVIEKAFLGKWLEKLPGVLRHIYALFFIVIGWLIFAFEDSAAGLSYFGVMFGFGASAFANGAILYELLRCLAFLTIAVIAAIPAPRRAFYRMYERVKCTPVLAGILCFAALVICTAYLVDSSFNPFLYFRF